MTPIRGTVAECFVHLMQIVTAEDEYLRKRQVIADFTGVVSPSVRRWEDGEFMPVGEPYIRLQFYLELLGYEVTELLELDAAVCDAARLVAFRVVTPLEVATYLGYTGSDRNKIDAALRALQGRRGLAEEKQAKLGALFKRSGKRLKARQGATEKVVVFVQTTSSPSSDAYRTVIIESFARSLDALLPLAEDMVSDRFSAEDREVLRALTNGGVSRLSRLLAQLSGEAARNALAQPNNGGGSK